MKVSSGCRRRRCSEDPAYADAVQWMRNTFYLAESGSLPKAEVYEAYCRYAKSGRGPVATNSIFGRFIIAKGTLCISGCFISFVFIFVHAHS